MQLHLKSDWKITCKKGSVHIRIDATYRLQQGDVARVPPMRTATADEPRLVPPGKFPTIYEDEALLVINKPSGMAVHGGSGVSFGVIEQLRSARPDARYLELVLRLDRETSGLLILAKKRSALVKLHEMLHQGVPQKHYYALALGQWAEAEHNVKLPLKQWHTETGEKRVKVADDGQYAHSVFTICKTYAAFTLVDVGLKTGRTHQVRVHMQHLGHPIAGDECYGDFARNRELMRQGVKRMFLHTHSLSLPHPLTDEPLQLSAPLPPELNCFLENLPK